MDIVRRTFILILPFLGLFVLVSEGVLGQYEIKIQVTGEKSHLPVYGASVTILGTNKSAITDSSGLVVLHELSRGEYTCLITCIGYESKKFEFALPGKTGKRLEITLE